MHLHQSLSALLFAVPLVSASRGFNYGSTFSDGRAKTQSNFEAEFKAAASLEGTNGAFTSARLYTMIQSGSTNDPISAIPAAISTGTSLLLGLWASAGDASFANELEALRKTISQYGTQLNGLIDGISIGSEDLYRLSPMGVAAGQYAGAEPDTLVKYIEQVRDVIKGTPFSGLHLGHVDTWTAWENATNKPVVDACDWIGMDAYPFFDDFAPNSISDDKDRWADGLGRTLAAVGGKEVWITETGWPVSGETVGSAVASPENAKKYWDDIGCPMFANNTRVWWYTFQDSSPVAPGHSFGVVGSTLSNKPLWDLSCPSHASSSASSSPSSSTTKTASSNTSTSTGGPSFTAVTAPSGPISGGIGSGRGNATYTPSSPTSPTASSNTGSSNNSSRTGTVTPTIVPGSGSTASVSFAVLACMIALALL